MEEEELALSEDKCEFFRKAVEFVGFWVDAEGIHAEESKIKLVKNWPTPRNQKEVMGFLGLTGFYRKFIHKYAFLALPLYEAAQQQQKTFSWKAEAAKAFDDLKQAVTSAPVLALPTPEGEWMVQTDASTKALGAILAQRQRVKDTGEVTERTIAFWSRKLTETEGRYPVYDRELLAIRDALNHWRYYLHGTRFTVYTNHAALQRILLQKNLSTRQITYLELLHSFDFRIKYIPGARNAVADALSKGRTTKLELRWDRN